MRLGATGTFGIQLLYKHGMHQVTIFADITDSTPDALAAIMNDSDSPQHASHSPARQAEVSDLLQRPMPRTDIRDHES